MKIFLDTVGCRLNQSEIEKFAFILRQAGHKIVEDASAADLAIVNTCTVTASAAADSRKAIRRIARAGCEKIIATGCLTSIDPQKVLDLPNVALSVPNQEKDDLISYIPTDLPDSLDGDLSFREPLPGKLKRTRAFIKVQDGCDNHCTFCITRIARGKSRSTDKAVIFKDVEYALNGGVKEIVLTGVNLGSWGKDLHGSGSLADLIKDLISSFNPPRIRLSSIEPWDIDTDLLEVLAFPSFCHHFHIPLQSGCDQTLKRMGRNMTSQKYKVLIDRIREVDPDIALTTDVIVGFPGETEHEFEQSLDFVKEVGFSGGHVFRFSPRELTPASYYSEKVDEKLKKSRAQKMRATLAKSADNYRINNLGKTVEVLWERSESVSKNKFRLSGLSGNYLQVVSSGNGDLYNQISAVKIGKIERGEVIGMIIEEIIVDG